MTTRHAPKRSRRKGRSASKKRKTSGVPYTMRLADGRTVYVEVPAYMAERDRSGAIAFNPQGVRFLDRVRARALKKK